MKAIDSLLKILVQQGGTELRLASDCRPQMFKGDHELPLTVPATPTRRIIALLDDVWSAHEAALRASGEIRVAYESAEVGRFDLRLGRRDDSTIDACFSRAAGYARDTAQPDVARAGVSASPGDRAAGWVEGGTAAPAPEIPPGLATLLVRAAERGASDLHLSPAGPPVIRINGALQTFDAAAEFDLTALAGGPDAIERLRNAGSVDRGFDLAGVGRVRANIYTSAAGICAALRFLTREAPALAALHLPPQVTPLVDLPHGLVVACGPTGCGKSTTLAALVQHALATRPQVLVTIEDPIEYVIRARRSAGIVRQREVGTHVRDFATGLRDALREDPDILLIGEMRDPETISLALTAAETGHLVFTSLHSRTAASAVERIVDTYPPERQRQIRVQLADALRAVISQRLIPLADGSGRVPAVETLRVTHAVSNLIREGKTAHIVSALQGGGSEGMQVLERSLADLVRANRIRRDAAVAAANDTAALNEYLRGSTG